jgi:predicted DCC family thiol-disulfide oxidoreductase YuxK
MPVLAGEGSDSRVAQSDGRAILLYDAECRFCRWSLDRILAWDRRGRLRPLALQDPEADRLLAGIDARRRMDSWHLLTAVGEVSSAGRAVAPLLDLLPAAGALAALARASPRLTDAAYGFVARHRSLLSRVVARLGWA